MRKHNYRRTNTGASSSDIHHFLLLCLSLSPKNSSFYNSNKSERSWPNRTMCPNPPFTSCLYDTNIKHINPLPGLSYISLEYLCSPRRIVDGKNK